MIDRLPTNETQYYDSAEDVLKEDDLIETDVQIVGWSRKFRIRALTFAQMAKINRNATIRETNKDLGIEAGELDNELWTYWTIVEGIVRPKFKIETAKRLADNNGEYVKILADEIWNIGRVSKKVWDEYIENIKTSNKIAENKVEELIKDEETKERSKV